MGIVGYLGFSGIPAAEMRIYPIGSVHGRFQPLHKGHLKYIMTAKLHCDFLHVGITQCDITSLVETPADPHRQEPANNPMSYDERADMITEVLGAVGIKLEQFDIIPFPIETPERLKYFLSTDVPIFTTICENWNNYKINVLRKQGYEVIVLWEERDKGYDGMIIRNLMCAGDDRWMDQVPSATIEVVDKYGILERIVRIRQCTGIH